MSNTIRLTSTRGKVLWGKSLNYDGQALADRTDWAWVAQDIDWPERDDYPRWFVPRGRERPGEEWIGGIVRESAGAVRFPGPLSDEDLAAIVTAGAIVWTEVPTHLYDHVAATIHYQHVDWSGVGS